MPRGFTLIDLMMTIAVIAILAVALMPAMSPEAPLRLVAAGTMLSSDIEYAQSATLAAPSDPTVVRFDPDANRYYLALASTPDVPITRPSGGEPYDVILGEGIAADLAGVSIAITDATDDTVIFDAFGRLGQLDDVTITLTNGAGDLTIVVRATTGSVFMGE